MQTEIRYFSGVPLRQTVVIPAPYSINGITLVEYTWNDAEIAIIAMPSAYWDPSVSQDDEGSV